MILGKITGKVTTTEFEFSIEGAAKKFDFVQVMHEEYDFVLCQIVEVTRDSQQSVAKCIVLGYQDDRGNLRPIRTPFALGTEVLKPEPEMIKKLVKVGKEDGAYIGRLEGTGIRVNLDLNRLLTGHISILAKSGSGKSYTLGVLLEEIIEKGIPALVLDPHGEYGSLAFPNEAENEKESLARFGVEPKEYKDALQIYGDPRFSDDAKPLQLDDTVTMENLLQIMPLKLSSAQQAMLFSLFQDGQSLRVDEIPYLLEQDQNPNKWPLLAAINSIRNAGVFSSNPTPLDEIIRPGKLSIVNLRGIQPAVQDILVGKLASDLFEQRKKGTIPPFLMVFEEAHHFAPERGFGESKSVDVIRTIVQEGRKFGLGVAVVTQRPALVQKSVLSQCTTQIILKTTNPNDLRTITSSVEGITSEADSEIKNLPIGTALLTGITDAPLFVRVRPRRTKHGGQAIQLLAEEYDKSFSSHQVDFSKKEMVNVILPRVSDKDLVVMADTPQELKRVLVPCAAFRVSDGGLLLMDTHEGKLVTDIDMYETKKVPDISSLGKDQLSVLKQLFTSKEGIPRSAFLGEVADSLVELGYVTSEGGNLILSDDHVFSALKKYAVFAKPELKEVKHDEKLEKRFSPEDVKNMVSQSASIEDATECYLLKRVSKS